ncbi:ATP-binding protein [Roseobacteraceae bacterium S113]
MFLPQLALAETLAITPGAQTESITPSLVFWPSLTPDVSTAANAWQNGDFAPELRTIAYSAGYSPETWAATRLVNMAPGDGRQEDRFLITFDAPLASGVRLFLVRENGLTENLLNYSIFEPFDARQHAITRLQTSEFTLAPLEEVLVFAHVQLGPFPNFAMQLHTPEHLDEARFGWGVSLTAFYAFALSCLVFFFGFQLAMRSALGAWSAALFLAFLGLIALVDGLWFRLLYPQSPQVQSIVGFGFLFAISAAGFLVAGAGIATQDKTLARKIRALALVSVAGFLVAIWVPGPLTAAMSYILIGIMLLSMMPMGRALQKDATSPPVGATAIAMLSLLGAMGVIALVVTGVGGRWLDAVFAMRAVFAFLLLATMTFLTANVIALRRRHLGAVEARVVALEAEAERSRELLEAERNYARARELAAHRQRQLATASHDLRQPLMSLRMTFDGLAAEMKPEVKSRLNEAFDYLSSLAAGYVDETVPIDAEQEDDAPLEQYAVAIPLSTVQQMFEGEATSKGLELRIVPTRDEVQVPPLVLMRILTNLVSNAIKYTDQGRVVVGLRQGGGRRLCVWDTGPGMSEQDVEKFQSAYSKGEKSTGHGLGLSVCFELARANNMRLEVHSVLGRGTCFSLYI